MLICIRGETATISHYINHCFVHNLKHKSESDQSSSYISSVILK